MGKSKSKKKRKTSNGLLTKLFPPSPKTNVIPQQKRVEKKRDFRQIAKLEEIKSLDPIAFEDFIGNSFKQLGYTVERTPIVGDEGIDLRIKKNGQLSIVQCKRYDKSVGAPVVRELYGTLIHTKATAAYLVTTSTITQPAKEWCIGKPIHLIDSSNLLIWLESARSAELKQKTLQKPLLKSANNLQRTEKYTIPAELESRTFSSMADELDALLKKMEKDRNV